MWRTNDRSSSNNLHYRAKLDYDENLKVIGSHCTVPNVSIGERGYYYNDIDPRRLVNRQTGTYQVEVDKVEPLSEEINSRIRKMNGITGEIDAFLIDDNQENQVQNTSEELGQDQTENKENSDKDIDAESLQDSKQNESENAGVELSQEAKQNQTEIELSDESQNDENLQKQNINQTENKDETQNEESSLQKTTWNGKSFRKRGINKNKYHDTEESPRKRRQLLPRHNPNVNKNKSVTFNDPAFSIFDDNGNLVIEDEDDDNLSIENLQRYRYIFSLLCSLLVLWQYNVIEFAVSICPIYSKSVYV